MNKPLKFSWIQFLCITALVMSGSYIGAKIIGVDWKLFLVSNFMVNLLVGYLATLHTTLFED